MKVTSNGSRKVIKLTSLWYNKTHYKPLMWTKKSWGGRSSFGRVSIWTKKSLKIKLIIPRINYSLRTSNIFFIDTLKLVPGSNKLIALIFLSCGGVSYIPTTESHKVFSIMHPVWKSFSSLSTSILATNQPFLVMMIKRLSKISLLELYPGVGIQYIRSSGCYGKLIKFDFDKHLVLVQLPSGVRKQFSIYSLGSLGCVSLPEKKHIANGKAGFLKNFGKKSIVRGVAMNPIDHPHGGRTKSIRYPRTPWGKTTKFK